MASFARLLRYAAAFFSLALPGFYLAVTNFHTQLLPTPLILSFWEARSGVPFPAALEVILMELAFELLREAGVRLPGNMGNTIGIVGGLIIGQAAVEANLVSPIVVIVVAFTALCSFAIPDEEFAFSFRILKFAVIGLSAWMGYFGFLIGIYMVLIHMAGLKSFGIPYLTPYVGAGRNACQDEKDALIRFPLRLLRKRPIYANPHERTKLKKKEK
jgi:spore germination protein